MRAGAGALLLLAALAACATPPRATQAPAGLHLQPVAFADLPGWTSDRQSEALIALRRYCPHLTAGSPAGSPGFVGDARDWQPACAELLELGAGDDAAARGFFERIFRPYRLSAPSGDAGFFTGYYQPEVAGSRHAGPGFPVPLYRRPPELAGDASYFTRAEIDGGALAGRGLELVFLASPVDAFFASIQGSAEVALAEGGRLAIGFDGSNGRGYVAIGRFLLERGEIAADQVSLQTIRAWLLAHPGEARALMERNPRYIFFHALPDGAPLGAAGVALTSGRSLAVDPAFLPFGAPLFIDTSDAAGRPLRRLMVAQDQGAAIKGPLRADVFWGVGPAAEVEAGAMKSPGRLYLLLPASLQAGS
jgi:membrane-bound lytic murein transglycosylase A